MKRKAIILPILLIFTMSCCFKNRQTEVEVIGGETERYVGKIEKNSNWSHGAEWLLLNVGNSRLHIDSIKSSCDCLELSYDSSMTAERRKYFPIRAIIQPEEGDTGIIYREIDVYGNFSTSPLTLSIMGEIKTEE